MAIAAILALCVVSLAENAEAQTPGAAAPNPAPAPYQSPFPSPHVGGPAEAADFAKLQPLEDDREAALAAYDALKACGSFEERNRAYKSFLASDFKLQKAVDAFVRQWSNSLHPSDNGPYDSHAMTKDKQLVFGELKRHSKKFNGTPACPESLGTTPPPAVPPGTSPSPLPCDDGTAAAKLATANEELSNIERSIERTERVMKADEHAVENEIKFSGAWSVKSLQLKKVVHDDDNQINDLNTKRQALLDQIETLKALKPCGPGNGATPPLPPSSPAPLRSPCYDDAAKADLVKSEKELAELNTRIDTAQGVVDDDKAKLARAEQAFGKDSADAKAYKTTLQVDLSKLSDLLGDRLDLQNHIDALNHLKSCTEGPPGKSEKTNYDDGSLGNILGNVTIGVGVEGGNGHDDHGDRGRTDKHRPDTPSPRD